MHVRALRSRGILTCFSVGYAVAEPTGMVDLAGYPDGTRVIVRRERPHPAAQLSAVAAAEAFGKAQERVGGHNVFLVDVSWDFAHDEDLPYTLSIYITFEREPEDSDNGWLC